MESELEQFKREIKEEIAGLATRLENTEGYFDNFNTTLENHMGDYKQEIGQLKTGVNNQAAATEGLGKSFNWGFWVIFGLLTLVIGCGGSAGIMLLRQYLELSVK